MTLANSELEPDVAVVSGVAEDFRLAHPTTAEMVIEVAISSIDLDREKSAVYAAADVSEYWIVMPEQRAIEVYTSPAVDGYQQMRRHEDVDAPLATTAIPDVSILPSELFG